LELRSHNSVAILAFPPQPAYPRLTRAVLSALDDHLAAIQQARCFRGVVIASNCASFATGAELEEIARLDGIRAREFARAGQAVLNRVAEFPAPVVAAIRGFCLGGGLDLALACHSRVATCDSTFGHPGPSIGLMTGWAGTQRLPYLLGRAAALHVLLTGERIPATQALTMGLIDELVDSEDLLEAAARRATMSTRNSRNGTGE
jgi:enoyl-CoA hydratase/carnithine racemase